MFAPPPVFRIRGFLRHFLLFCHLRLQYVVLTVACRIQYDGMTLHCQLPLPHNDAASLCRSA